MHADQGPSYQASWPSLGLHGSRATNFIGMSLSFLLQDEALVIVKPGIYLPRKYMIGTSDCKQLLCHKTDMNSSILQVSSADYKQDLALPI